MNNRDNMNRRDLLMDTEQIFKMIIEYDNEQLAQVLDDTLDYTARDSKGDTFLHCAAREENPEAFELLLSKGKSKIDETDSSGSSVLSTACAWGSLRIVELILADYAFAFDINEGMKQRKKTPFTLLAYSQNSGDAQLAEKKEHLLILMTALNAKTDSVMLNRRIEKWQEERKNDILEIKAAYYNAALEFVERIQPVNAVNRFALRKAYYQLAETEYYRGDLESAMDHLNFLFSIADMKDEKELFAVEYEELRVHVYKVYAEQHEGWIPYYKEVLQTIVDNNIPLQDQNIYEDITNYDVNVTGKYTLLQNEAAVRQKDENFLDAFNRYRTIIGTDKGYELGEAAADSEITVAESKIGMKLPQALKMFYMNTANGLSDELLMWCNGLDFSGLDDITGFFESVQEWFGDDDFDFVEESEISPETEEFVNNNYKVFATFYENEDSHYKFFFGKNGKFGISPFQQDGLYFDSEILEPEMSLLRYDDFDELMSKFFQRLINIELCRQNLLEDTYWRSLESIEKIR